MPEKKKISFFSWNSMSIANTDEEKIPFISSILHFRFFSLVTSLFLPFSIGLVSVGSSSSRSHAAAMWFPFSLHSLPSFFFLEWLSIYRICTRNLGQSCAKKNCSSQSQKRSARTCMPTQTRYIVQNIRWNWCDERRKFEKKTRKKKP